MRRWLLSLLMGQRVTRSWLHLLDGLNHSVFPPLTPPRLISRKNGKVCCYLLLRMSIEAAVLPFPFWFYPAKRTESGKENNGNETQRFEQV